MSYDDDNYGHWDELTSEEDETKEYQRKVREESVKKECVMCGQTVYLMPHYNKCDSCCRKLEAGYQF
jgi:hypothetical protein